MRRPRTDWRTLVTHANAKLTPAGRLPIIKLIESGFPQAEVARRLCTSRATVAKWGKRYREEGTAGLKDRSSRAHELSHALGQDVIDTICQLRREAGFGPHRIAYAVSYRRSSHFKAVAARYDIGQRFTRPYRSQTNGKAEAFNKTLQREWAYRRPYLSNASRLDELPVFLHDYNHDRPHTSLGNLPPASRR